jgi:hypothetical protein
MREEIPNLANLWTIQEQNYKICKSNKKTCFTYELRWKSNWFSRSPFFFVFKWKDEWVDSRSSKPLNNTRTKLQNLQIEQKNMLYLRIEMKIKLILEIPFSLRLQVKRWVRRFRIWPL